MEDLIVRLHKHWALYRGEEQALSGLLPPRLQVQVAREEGEILQLETWVEWLRAAEEALAFRCTERRRLMVAGVPADEDVESVTSMDIQTTTADLTVGTTSQQQQQQRSSSLLPAPLRQEEEDDEEDVAAVPGVSGETATTAGAAGATVSTRVGRERTTTTTPGSARGRGWLESE